MRNNAEVLHGDIAQKQREVTLKRFREGKFNVLVATDVAARGLDIPNVDLVIQLDPPKEIEAYIHRSGRTARAGKEGMCITFYQGREFDTLQDIEYRAGIKFKKISPPKNEDIIKVSAVDVLENLRKVDKKILPFFEEAAEKFLEEVSPKEALAMALAFISDTSQEHISCKSFLTGEEGVVTYLLKTDRGINSVTYGHNMIQRNISEHLALNIKGLRILASGEGVAFDIPEGDADELDNEFKQGLVMNKGMPFTLERAGEIPELLSDSKYGRSGGYNQKFSSGVNSQRYGRNDYESSNNFGSYKKSSNYGSKNFKGGRNDYQNKTGDRFDAEPQNDDFGKNVSGISFGGKPTFFTRNKSSSKLDEADNGWGQRSNNVQDDDGSQRGGRGRGRGIGSRGGRPFARGRPRGRGYY
jgi:ATP-dependent RNA helicase DDX50